MTAVASKAVEYCQQVTKESGTSFYWAFQLMPSPKREAMWALYAFCRYLDDIVDDDHQERNPPALLAAPEFGEQRRCKVEEVGGAPRATIFHTEGVVGFVGIPSCFPDPPRHSRLCPGGELRC